ncbi:MAG TPA: prepilin-type N-terminal cleavage/methylation domain-containing protein [Tepidisphaeraceae bacterium]
MTAHSTSVDRAAIRLRRSGFTLVEMLVVMGIIAALAAILLPTITRAWRSSMRARARMDMETISVAIEAYRNDFNAYPTPVTAGTAQQVLVQALIGPGGVSGPAADGFAGPGFRVRPGGRVWGPYLPPDKVRLRDPLNRQNASPAFDRMAIFDAFDRAILYFPAHGKSDKIKQANGYMTNATTALYNPKGLPKNNLFNFS